MAGLRPSCTSSRPLPTLTACQTCVFVLHHEALRLLKVQRTFRQLSYFDLHRRSHLMIQFACLTLGLPIAIEDALRQQRAEDCSADADAGAGAGDSAALLNRRVYALLRGVVSVLERMEGFVCAPK